MMTNIIYKIYSSVFYDVDNVKNGFYIINYI